MQPVEIAKMVENHQEGTAQDNEGLTYLEGRQ